MSATTNTAEILGARKNLPVCVLDDEPAQMTLAKDLLERAGFPAVGTVSFDDAMGKIRLGSCRVVLADSELPGSDGLVFLEKALHQDPGIFVILMSEVHSVDSAIQAIKHGAFDYLCKPLDYPRLTRALDDLAEHLQQSRRSSAGENLDWRPLPLSEMRRIHIQRVLKTCDGNRVRAARMLGIGRTSLYRFLKSADKLAAAGARA
jgi:two-component system response regulator RegA